MIMVNRTQIWTMTTQINEKKIKPIRMLLLCADTDLAIEESVSVPI